MEEVKKQEMESLFCPYEEAYEIGLQEALKLINNK